LRVLVVNTSDAGGGAEMTSWNVFQALRRRGHQATMVVGRKKTADANVVSLSTDADRNPWARLWIALGDRLQPLERQVHGATRFRDGVYWASEPIRWIERALGHEDVHYPGTWTFFEHRPFDIVHCFNLHGEYFDLRVLPHISRRRPVILDLCDAWLLSGHCAHALNCDRWKTGCGSCPDLALYPAVRRDGTAYNWRRKQRLFAKSSLYVTTPSQWLLQRARESMLAPAMTESRVIPTGVDRSIFSPGDRPQARAELGLPHDARILLFVANKVRRNPYKDYQTVVEAVRVLGRRWGGEPLLLIALGGAGESHRIGGAEIRFVPNLDRPVEVAPYYRAADMYLHAARADTFPRAILEALACGVPVVATAVGGIPEQIRTLGRDPAPTGVLVPAADPSGMAAAAEHLLEHPSLSRMLGDNAARDAAERFDLERQTDIYLDWYEQLITRTTIQATAAARPEHAVCRPDSGAVGAESVSELSW
jgi:glycosyltransferase involved in cell wall biosynthesis